MTETDQAEEMGLVLEFENLGLEDGDGKNICQNFEGFTLFLPAVSVGNVGQLSTDLLLANLPEGSAPVKVGRIFHPSLEPVVGSDITQPNGLMTSCEVFVAKELKYVIIHFHSPVTMRGRPEFVSSLVKWIEDHKFSQVVCFSSIFASDRIDHQLIGIPFRYLSTDSTAEPLTQKFQELEWKQLEKRQFPAPAVFENNSSAEMGGDEGVLHLPGSGITKLLYEECQLKQIPFLALIMFASEGDNTPEAMTLFQMADRVFHFRPSSSSSTNTNQDISPGGREKLIVPISWTHFGEESHPSLY